MKPRFKNIRRALSLLLVMALGVGWTSPLMAGSSLYPPGQGCDGLSLCSPPPSGQRHPGSAGHDMHNDMHDMAECAASPPPEPGPVSIIPAAHAPYPSSQEEQCLNMMCCFIHTSALSMPAPDFPSSPWGFVLPGTEERLTSLAPQNLFRPPRA